MQKRVVANRSDGVSSLLELVDLTPAIAHAGGEIYATLSRSGKQVEFNDCLIAATVKHCGFTFYCNKKQ